MGIFGNLGTEGLEKSEDRLGGFQSYETDAYDATVKLAYAGKSTGGAQNVTFVFDLPGGKEYRETVYVTNKKGENWFLNQNDKSKKVPLPGFTVVNDICLMTTDKPLSEQSTEEKVVKIYDFDEKKEMPKSVDVLVDLLGHKVTLGIIATLENKNKKNDATGEYEPIAEERTVNTIDKVFHDPTKLTTTEAEQGLSEGVFYASWVERNQGKTRDKRSIKDGQGGTSGRPGKAASSPPAAGGGERKSLFGKS